MAKFKVVLERTDTITKQAEIVVEAATVDEAKQQIAVDLEVDAGAYDDDLKQVAEDIGEVTVVSAAMEAQNDNQVPGRKFG